MRIYNKNRIPSTTWKSRPTHVDLSTHFDIWREVQNYRRNQIQPEKTSVRGSKDYNKKNDQLINISTYIITFNTPKPPSNHKIGYMIAKVETLFPVATTVKILGTTKVGAQEREYVKNVERMVLTTQNPPANNLYVLTAMEITRLTRDCASWKRKKKS